VSAYYNEIDPYAAQWLRNLIAAGHIAAGDVDERSIVDVAPSELAGYTQCHFFAGIGVWSLALRRAGWADDRPVWTGSCPCQPFSAAGKGAGFDDERHLWPAFHHLIEQCRPAAVLGEQVASKDADPWINLVQADLEAVGYGFGAIAFPSAGVGAPHIRDRLYWVAHADSGSGFNGHRPRQLERVVLPETRWAKTTDGFGADLPPSRLGHSQGDRPEVRQHVHGKLPRQGLDERCDAGGLADSAELGWIGRGASQASDGGNATRIESERFCNADRPGPTNSLWRDADWLLCRDGKWRPVEPGTFPLAHGAPARVGRLRAYGNAINAEAARVWIETVMECTP